MTAWTLRVEISKQSKHTQNAYIHSAETFISTLSDTQTHKHAPGSHQEKKKKNSHTNTRSCTTALHDKANQRRLHSVGACMCRHTQNVRRGPSLNTSRVPREKEKKNPKVTGATQEVTKREGISLEITKKRSKLMCVHTTTCVNSSVAGSAEHIQDNREHHSESLWTSEASARQMGHVLLALSHLSTHFPWNSWLQGRTRSSWRVSKSLMHTTHSV